MHGHPHTGPLVRMIIEISIDMVPFLVVMTVLILGFSGAFYILFTPADGVDEVPSGFADFKSTLLSTFLMMLGDFDIVTFREGTAYSNMAITMFCAYQARDLALDRRCATPAALRCRQGTATGPPRARRSSA